MANIQVRKDNGGQVTQQSKPVLDPMRWMRDMMRWDPFQEMAPAFPESAIFAPAFEIMESQDTFTFKADVPGVKLEDIEVTATGNRLRVSGKREAEHTEKTDTYYACERSYGSFARAFTLPDGTDTDHIKASVDNGVLTIAVPKKPEAQARKIVVKPEAKSKS
ncbi:MAG: Hsp20/alpha crystallin family protein [Deltaproteobacteria bacterium]|nr:Hsp20/alpha crystallin family protein [Deltaproteobacteria bacterium]